MNARLLRRRYGAACWQDFLTKSLCAWMLRRCAASLFTDDAASLPAKAWCRTHRCWWRAKSGRSRGAASDRCCSRSPRRLARRGCANFSRQASKNVWKSFSSKHNGALSGGRSFVFGICFYGPKIPTVFRKTLQRDYLRLKSRRGDVRLNVGMIPSSSGLRASTWWRRVTRNWNCRPSRLGTGCCYWSKFALAQ